MITLSYSDAVKLLKQYSIEDVMNLDSYNQKKEYDNEVLRLQKKIESLERKIIQFENQKCLYDKKIIKSGYRFVTISKNLWLSSHIYKLLSEDCNLSKKEIVEVCNKYGAFAGARNYAYRMLGQPIPIPEYQCDNERKEILMKYRELRDTVGIKEANKYFISADNKLRGIEEV